MSKTFWAIIAVIVVVFGGILLFKGNKANAPSAHGAQPTNHITGNAKANVTLVEYGDYECPYCGAYAPIVKQVVQKYSTQLRFQFINLPLLQVHRNAFAAARAAEAANLQGKFWEMHDMLYDQQKGWADSGDAQSLFEQYARDLNLNVATFEKDMSSSSVNDVINADIAKFQKTGLDESTPTFLLDGKKITPGYSPDAFSALIDPEIAAKNK